MRGWHLDIMSYAVNTSIIHTTKMKISKQIIWIFMTLSDNCRWTSGWLPISFVWDGMKMNQCQMTTRRHHQVTPRAVVAGGGIHATLLSIYFYWRLLLLTFDFDSDSNQKIKYLFFECFYFEMNLSLPSENVSLYFVSTLILVGFLTHEIAAVWNHLAVTQLWCNMLKYVIQKDRHNIAYHPQPPPQLNDHQ